MESFCYKSNHIYVIKVIVILCCLAFIPILYPVQDGIVLSLLCISFLFEYFSKKTGKEKLLSYYIQFLLQCSGHPVGFGEFCRIFCGTKIRQNV